MYPNDSGDARGNEIVKKKMHCEKEKGKKHHHNPMVAATAPKHKTMR